MKLSQEVKQFLDANPEWRDDIDLIVAPPGFHEATTEYPELEDSNANNGMPAIGGIPRISLYFRSRRLGNTHRFAEMIACQSSPCIMTDSVFFQGMPCLGDQFADERQKNNVINRAIKNGYAPCSGDVYQSGLARFQGDPEAFVPRSGGRGYIKQLCEQRGWACEGAVETPYREPESDPYDKETPLAEDLVQKNTRAALKRDPGLSRMDRKELRNKIIKHHGPSDK